MTYQVVEDLVTDDAGHLEALLARHRVDDEVAMDADKVLGVEDAVFVLCCVALTMSAAFFQPVFSLLLLLLLLLLLQGHPLTCPAVSIISVAKSWFL